MDRGLSAERRALIGAGIGALAGLALLPGLALGGELRGTGDMGVVVERATGSVLIVDHPYGEVQLVQSRALFGFEDRRRERIALYLHYSLVDHP